MKKNSSGWTKHLPNTRAVMCLKVLPTHQLIHHYYPVHHDKNPADGSSGHLKRKFIRYKKSREKAIRVAQKLFEFAANKLNTEEREEGKYLHYQTRIKYFETITRGPINESKTIPKHMRYTASGQ